MTVEIADPCDAWFEAALAQTPEVRAVEVEGASIDARAWGERGKPGLLLMHGAGAHADWWSFIAPFFADRYRVAAFSWSGMGRSGWREAYSMDLYAREAFAVAEALGLLQAEEKPVFAAHSFGGRVILRCAAGERGGELKAAIPIDTLITPPGLDLGGRPFAPGRARLYPSREAVLARFRLIPPQPCIDRRLVDYVAGGSVHEVNDPALGQGWTWRFDPALWTRLADVASIDDLAAARCPVAAIRGAKSALMVPPVTAHFDSHAPRGTPIVTVPEAHHHLMLDQPLALIAALNGLLAAWPNGSVR